MKTSFFKYDGVGFIRKVFIGILFVMIILISLFVFLPMDENKKVNSTVPEAYNINPDSNHKYDPKEFPSGQKFIVNPFVDSLNASKVPPVEKRIELPPSTKIEITKNDIVKKENSDVKKIRTVSALPFPPRQVLEVIPKKVDGAEGVIKLSVLVGIDGKVKQYKILNNTTESQTCLNSVVEAVNKSKWQPVLLEGDKVEYWIEKTYTFN